MIGLEASYLAAAREAALAAGELLLGRFRGDIEVSKKGRINLVTEMDLAAEKVVVDTILGRFPGHGILAEEGSRHSGDGIHRWIIDPLDGTTNYAHGYRFFSVSIALEARGALVLGVVFDPVTRELFSAVKGEGAFLNDRPIRVSSETALIDSLLCTGFSYQEEEIERNLSHFNRVIFCSRAVRRDGSAALDLAYVACGCFDGFWELSLSPWDVAAGLLLVQEAGGRVSAFDGSPCSVYDREFLATNGGIHAELSGLLTEAGEGPGSPP